MYKEDKKKGAQAQYVQLGAIVSLWRHSFFVAVVNEFQWMDDGPGL
ncbi:hypothetical protein NIASO_09350 [Niabella soli DSM 19437]|uniref:Uncharacterized protein n=1 Tax=Niabella soli DSM 19437 TaxID=929713 RepID=W0F834_9BACT|nr:hypothetical protein NIASO_09350 [Niabella soli DSM 19437]